MLVLCLTYAWLSLEGAWHWQGANILLHAQWSCSSTVEQATKISNFNFYFSPFFYFPEHYYLRILQPAFYIHLCTIQDFIGSLICLDRRYWNSKKLFLVKLMVWFMFFFSFSFSFSFNHLKSFAYQMMKWLSIIAGNKLIMMLGTGWLGL